MHEPSSPSDLRNQADRLVGLAEADPRGALAAAPAVADAAVAAGEWAAAAVACRALGLAAARLDRMPVAVDHLERAHRFAAAAGDPAVAVAVDITYAGVRSWAGDPHGGLAVLDPVLAQAGELDRVRALAQRGLILQRMGRFAEALVDLDEAERGLAAHGDDLWRARVLTNRGLARTYVGSRRDAEADLLAAQEIYEARRVPAFVAETRNNLGWVSAQQGDVVAALGYFDEAARLLSELGYPLAQLSRDRAEALLAAHLTAEALQSAQLAADELRAAGHAAGYHEALATLALAALAAGESDRAAAAGTELAQAAAAQRMDAQAAYGRYLALEACTQSGAGRRPSWRAAARVAAELDAAGMATPTLQAQLLAAELALRGGRLDVAAEWLARVDRRRRAAPLAVRVRARLAAARLRLARGNRASAARALAAGLDAVEEHQAALGATETRAAVAAHGRELGRLGVELAAAAGRPRRLFEWMERSRASALRFPPVAPTGDPEAAAARAQLRWVERQLGEAAGLRRLRELTAQRAALEHQLLARSRLAAGAGRVLPRVTAGDVLDRVGDGALVMFGHVGDRIHALVAARGRVRHHAVGAAAEVTGQLLRLRVAIRRHAGAARAPARPPVGNGGTAADRRALDALLWEGVRLPDGPLVVVPPAQLFAVPWSLLPSLRGRPLTIAPSAATWLRCSGQVPQRGVLLANGPRLAHGAAETRMVRAVHRRATRLVARDARVGAVLDAIGRHDIVHIVAHGALRGDNPQFSSLDLADGRLKVFDLEALRVTPALMVLSSCDTGLTAEVAGSEMLGFVASLLALGTGTVVAGIGLVPDTTSTGALMRRFHAGVAEGRRPAAALAAAIEPLDLDDPAAASLAGFTAFGGS